MPTSKPYLAFTGSLLVLAACGQEPLSTQPDIEPETATLSASATQARSFYQISAGIDASHTCAVTTTNQAYCWGGGWLGNGPNSAEVAGGYRFRQISTGWNYACAVTTDNRAFCWGRNHRGQLGDGSTTDRAAPVPAAPNLRFREITAGNVTTCGRTTGDRVYCWGSSSGGRMGTGTYSAGYGNPPTQIAGGRTYKQVDIGLDHGCAVTYSGEIYCWGLNEYGQLGVSSTAKVRFVPTRVSGTRSFTQVSAGWRHTCAVTSVKRAFCWGAGESGQIGDGSTLNRREPRQVAGSTLFDRVTAGGYHACAESTNNRAYCWGNNSWGGIGDGTRTQRTRPVAVAGGLWFAQLTAGNGYSCGVTSENRGYCWGMNDRHQLSDGTSSDRLTPTPIVGPT